VLQVPTSTKSGGSFGDGAAEGDDSGISVGYSRANVCDSAADGRDAVVGSSFEITQA
jgi:hypothetical protein